VRSQHGSPPPRCSASAHAGTDSSTTVSYAGNHPRRACHTGCVSRHESLAPLLG
jgi:hypothetical protein